MKKTITSFSGKLLLPVIFFGVFTACHNDDSTQTSVITGADSATPGHEEASSDQTHVAQMDTSGTHPTATGDSTAKTVAPAASADTASKVAAGKKGRKGKVTIAASDVKPGTGDMEADKEGFYKTTEVLPAFPGGQQALERFFEDNIKYPEKASDDGVEGTVTLNFNVDETGKIYQPTPVGIKLGSGLEDEAIRVFNKMPRWTPGKIKGKNVKTRFTLPIHFQLEQ